MTIQELISILQDAAEEIGEDAEVRLAHQPSWPFEYSLSGDFAIGRKGQDDLTDFLEAKDDPDNEWTDFEKEAAAEEEARLRAVVDESKPVFYLGEGSQLGYLPGDIKKELGW